MGKVIGLFSRRAPSGRPALELALGAGLALAVPLGFAVTCAALLAVTRG
jgi:hypothetical protein